MAYKKIQFKRGTKTGMPVLRSGEPGFTQDEKSLYIGDGAANQRFLNEVQVGTKIDEKIAPVTQSITNNVAALNESITNNIATVNQAITDKAKINGTPTNVNFIRNEIVQDYISTAQSMPSNSNFTVLKLVKLTGTKYERIIDFSSVTEGWRIEVDENLLIRVIFKKNGVTTADNFKNKSGTFMASKPQIDVVYCITQTVASDGTSSFSIFDGNEWCYASAKPDTPKTISVVSTPNSVYYYNRVLELAEINHTFTVLNSTPSINKINDYAISIDTHHIETPTGVTQEERYTELLKSTCKEFTSNGEAITVSNGIAKQKVLSGKIEGRTVKNLCPTEDIIFITGTGSSWGGNSVPLNSVNLNTNSIYTLMVIVYENTMDKPYNLNQNDVSVFNESLTVNIGQVGVFKKVMTTRSSFEGYPNAIRSQSTSNLALGNIKFQRMLFEGDVFSSIDNIVKSYIPFGLSSTQAIISNNGQKYTFYESTINGKTKVMRAPKGTQNWVEIDPREMRDTNTYDYKLLSSVLDLFSVPSGYDYVDRAKKVKIINTKELVFNGSENGWNRNDLQYTNTIRFECLGLVDGKAVDADKIICSNFVSAYNDLTDYEHCRNGGVGYPTTFIVYVDKTKLSSQDVDGFKKWLAANPMTVRYQLATPIEVPMTDEEIRAYDLYCKVLDLGGLEGARNTFEFMPDGSAVYKKNIIEYTLDGGDSKRISVWWTLEEQNKDYACFYWPDLLKSKSDVNTVNCISSSFKSVPRSHIRTFPPEECMASSDYDCVVVSIAKTKLSEVSVAGFKSWLKTNPITVRYILNTPIVTVIPKELIPSILTDVKNEIKVDSAVAPTNLTVKLPVDRIAEIQAQLDQVTALITTPSNINLTMNYIEDEYNKNQSIEGVV